MATLYHPTLPTTVDVPDSQVADWLEQGWLKPEPTARPAESIYEQMEN